MPERPASYYDEYYKNKKYVEPREYPIYAWILERLYELKAKTILDIGCGRGDFISVCQKRGFICYGFDFSYIAIEQAKKMNGLENIWVGDACLEENYKGQYDAYVSIETLEHIKEDLKVVKNLKPGIPFLFSVPSWNSPAGSHVRCFRNEKEIRNRFGKLLDIKEVKKIGNRHVALSRTM